mgnify:CR=1 FL=1
MNLPAEGWQNFGILSIILSISLVKLMDLGSKNGLFEKNLIRKSNKKI